MNRAEDCLRAQQGCFVAERPWRTVRERYRSDGDVGSP